MENLNKYVKNDEEAPLEVLTKFIWELKVSNLMIPVRDEDSFDLECIFTEDDKIFVPLFTDIEEFNRDPKRANEYIPRLHEFEFYSGFLLENDFGGYVLNIAGNEMIINKDFMKEICYDVEVNDEDDIEAYDGKKLKEIFETVSNDSLIDFISSDDNIDIERMYVELSDSILLNAVVSDESMDEKASGGIIDGIEESEMELLSIDYDGVQLGALFTDKDALKQEIDDEFHYYGQVTHLSEYFDFILRNDLDGVVINPASDRYIIIRDEILPQASGIEVVIDNPALKNSFEYIFLI